MYSGQNNKKNMMSLDNSKLIFKIGEDDGYKHNQTVDRDV